MKVTKVFTDFPAISGNYPGLVDNLNLIVKAPDEKSIMEMYLLRHTMPHWTE